MFSQAAEKIFKYYFIKQKGKIMPLGALPPFLIIYITYQARHLSGMEVGLKAFMLINHIIVIMHIFVFFAPK